MCGKLVVLAGPLCGEAFPVESTGVTIGRDTATQISIPDRLMSRRHCEVQALDGTFVLRDLGSSNGTFVNGIPTRERALQHGDRIRVGDSVLLFLDRQGGHHASSTGQGLTDGAIEDRTTRMPRPVAVPRPQSEAESPVAIMAEVLAGRVTLHAHDMVGESAPMRAVYERIRKVGSYSERSIARGASTRRPRGSSASTQPTCIACCAPCS